MLDRAGDAVIEVDLAVTSEGYGWTMFVCRVFDDPLGRVVDDGLRGWVCLMTKAVLTRLVRFAMKKLAVSGGSSQIEQTTTSPGDTARLLIALPPEFGPDGIHSHRG